MTHLQTVAPITIPKHLLFELGDALIYYHLWKGWEKPKDQQWFTWLKPKDIEQFALGDEVWIDVDPLYQSGKVYGCILVRITNIEGSAKHGMKINFTSPSHGGFTRISPDQGSKFAILTDEEKVFAWSSVHDGARHV